MSLDLFVWLSGSVELPRDLPRQMEWRYSKLLIQSIAGLSKEQIGLLEGHESWQIERGNYSIRVSRMDSADGLGDAASQSAVVLEARSEAELANKVKTSKARVSLVLEGDYEAGYLEQAAIAEHLAKSCSGAVLEGPAGYNEIDELGRWK